MNAKLSVLAVIGAIGTFHLAFAFERGAPIIVVFLGCMFTLAWAPTARFAFWSGMVIGLAIYAPWLEFFWTVFGPAAISLWSILALWLALFLLTAHSAVRKWPRWGVLAIPMLWMGFEYARSELYMLRFSWLNPGMAFSGRDWLPLVSGGMFGIAALFMLAFAMMKLWPKRGLAGAVAIGCSVLIIGMVMPAPTATTEGPKLVGIQLEFPQESTMLKALDSAKADEPDAELFVLGEYMFEGPPSEAVRDWCRTNRTYLVAGGKESLHAQPGAFFNTAYVIGPTGDIVFRQAKSVPIQFFDDGTPAPSQAAWRSPWGKIGLAICYDLSYSRVIDGLIRDGAQALIIPTMDMTEWGKTEHLLHSRMGPLRAREYRVGAVRICTSGVSQIVEPDGTITDSAEYPGVGKRIVGTLPMVEAGRIPADRYAAPLASAGSLAMVIMLVWGRYAVRFRRFVPVPSDELRPQESPSCGH